MNFLVLIVLGLLSLCLSEVSVAAGFYLNFKTNRNHAAVVKEEQDNYIIIVSGDTVRLSRGTSDVVQRSEAQLFAVSAIAKMIGVGSEGEIQMHSLQAFSYLRTGERYECKFSIPKTLTMRLSKAENGNQGGEEPVAPKPVPETAPSQVVTSPELSAKLTFGMGAISQAPDQWNSRIKQTIREYEALWPLAVSKEIFDSTLVEFAAGLDEIEGLLEKELLLDKRIGPISSEKLLSDLRASFRVSRKKLAKINVSNP